MSDLNKLAFFCTEVREGVTYGKYFMFIASRPVFYVYVSADVKDDEGHFKIFISKAQDDAPLIETKGCCGWDDENNHVEGKHIQAFVYTTLPLLMADLLVGPVKE